MTVRRSSSKIVSSKIDNPSSDNSSTKLDVVPVAQPISPSAQQNRKTAAAVKSSAVKTASKSTASKSTAKPAAKSTASKSTAKPASKATASKTASKSSSPKIDLLGQHIAEVFASKPKGTFLKVSEIAAAVTKTFPKADVRPSSQTISGRCRDDRLGAEGVVGMTGPRGARKIK